MSKECCEESESLRERRMWRVCRPDNRKRKHNPQITRLKVVFHCCKQIHYLRQDSNHSKSPCVRGLCLFWVFACLFVAVECHLNPSCKKYTEYTNWKPTGKLLLLDNYTRRVRELTAGGIKILETNKKRWLLNYWLQLKKVDNIK